MVQWSCVGRAVLASCRELLVRRNARGKEVMAWATASTMVEGMELPAWTVTSSTPIATPATNEFKWASFGSDNCCSRHFSDDEKGPTTGGENRVSKIKPFGGELNFEQLC